MSSEKSAKDQKAGVITTDQASKLLMITTAWLGNLEKQGFVTKVGRGRWNLVNVVQGYINYLRDEDRRSSKSASHAKLQDLRVERMKREMEIENRDLVRLEDATIVLDTAANLMRSTLMAVPAQFTRDKGQRRKLEKLIADALNSISDGMAARSDALKSGGEALESVINGDQK